MFLSFLKNLQVMSDFLHKGKNNCNCSHVSKKCIVIYDDIYYDIPDRSPSKNNENETTF